MTPAERKRVRELLREIEIDLAGILGMQRLLLAEQLIKDGYAKNLREASRIVRDPQRLAALYPVPA